VRHIDQGIFAMAGPDSVVLRTPMPVRGEGLSTAADFTVRAGERVPLILTWYPSYEPLPAEIDAEESLAFTTEWWRNWAKACVGCDSMREPVIRSLITLKALAYAPTGGIVAAATTSLPEHIGGVRNWDYRYCWLRDATFTLYSLLAAGFDDEALAWRDWLLRAVAGSPDKLQIMYSLTGRRRLTEVELRWLPGYENSSPVRIGNAAADQFQLDVYGEVCDMLHQRRREGLEHSEAAWRFEEHLLNFLESNWRSPDEGIWEVRGPRRKFTQSKIMAWVAFDRAVKAVEHFQFEGPAERWARLRDTIHLEVCQHGFNSELNSFVQFYDGDTLDASLLMAPLVGFLPADDPRVQGTLRAIESS
jgi:GH15 family glucan-1,4-alpha-glucosidase